MKVQSIQPYLTPDRSGRKFFIVRVETDNGIVGLGEVGIGNWGGAIAQAVEHLSEIVIDADPLATERLWQRMFRSGFFPADKVYSCAISAIDMALWDIKGKALDLPVYKLLGGPVRDKVVCYPHNRGGTLEELISSCQETKAQGWKFVRFDLPAEPGSMSEEGMLFEPREGISRGVHYIQSVKEAIGG